MANTAHAPKNVKTFHSSRRPGQAPSSEQVVMQMIHRLPGSTAVVGHEAVTRLQARLFREVPRQALQLPQKGLIFVGYRGQAWDVFLGHDQQVRRRLRIYILKDHGGSVLKDLLRRDTPVNDFAE